MGREFLPPFNEGTITVNVLAQPGISLPASNAIGTPAEQLLLRIPDVSSTGRRTGRAELDEHAEGVHYTEIEVRLKPGARPREAVMADIRRRLSTLPGVDLNIGQPISHRLDHLLSGTQAQVAVKLFGPDLDTLVRKAAEIDAQMKTVPGVVDVSTEKQTRIPQIRVEIDRHAAAQYGLQVGEINQTLETSLNGRVVSQAIDGEKRIDIVVRLDDAYRNSFKQYKDVLIDGPTGTKVPLGSVARVTTAAGPNQILRENVQRRIVIQANVAGRDLGSAVDDIRRAVGDHVRLDPGYFVTYGGQFESQQHATRLLILLSVFVIVGVFVVLYSHFRSAAIALQIMANIPLAIIGGVVAVFVSGGTLSIASLVGFITLAGIAARNGIMMISHYLHLVQQEGESFDEKMIVRGSLERLVPVLMTGAHRQPRRSAAGDRGASGRRGGAAAGGRGDTRRPDHVDAAGPGGDARAVPPAGPPGVRPDHGDAVRGGDPGAARLERREHLCMTRPAPHPTRTLLGACSVFLIALAPVARAAQGSGADLSGAVTDATGASLADASIAATNLETGVARRATTDGAGRYRLPALAPGESQDRR